MCIRGNQSAQAAFRLERADWLAVTLLIVGGVVFGIDGMLQCDVLGSALSQVLTVADGIKGPMGIAALYAIGRLLLDRQWC